ncbi:MAG TPA: sodium:solute symporter family protein [Tenuifilaceae bacterium]|jgi:SSS family solute:Na+ symporter|nr:sodium:solute symporter family protein [Bacteroidales bacterium]HNY09375.1 sodium:solute symporter family protein [Tenuifilaceae bacterium]MBP8642530.1 sodium:solute symporter family protein [Bacteroidales bacterium]NLI88129.1 sodium:solute symporter family protein [Bacteroidales bacterium]HOA08780.1 sodium:solute symporter family protein [Tenuifilaceae bacterium]
MESLLTNTYFWVVLAYFAVVLFISFFTKKLASRSSADFLVAGRNLGLLVCSMVVAAEWLGGLSTVGVSEKAFDTLTLQPILYNFSTAIGMVILGFTLAKAYRERKVNTVSEMVESIFGKRARSISAIAFLIAFITLAYVELTTFATVLSPIFNINWVWAVIIAATITTIYTYMGGMHALTIVAVFNLVVRYVGLGIALIIGLVAIGDFSNLTNRLVEIGAPQNLYNPFSIGWNAALSLILGGIFGGMASQASIQPIFAAKNPITAKRAAILSAVFIAPFGIITGILGLIARSGLFFEVTPGFNPKMALPRLLMTPEFVHPVIGGIAIAAILAAILSTIGPVSFSIVTIATKDIYHGLINKKASDEKILQFAKRLVILVNLVTVPLALFMKGAILDAGYFSYAIRTIGAIVILLGIYKLKWISTLSVQLSFIGGTLAIIISIVAKKFGWFDIDKTYASIIATVFFIIIGNIYTKYFTGKQKSSELNINESATK